MKKFSEYFSISSKNGLSKSFIDDSSGVKIVNMKELFGYNPITDDVEMRTVQLSKSEIERFELISGDLLFGRRSLVYEGSGKTTIFRGNKSTVFESSIIRVRLDSEKANSDFVNYYFNSPFGRASVLSIVTGAAVFGIRGSDLANLIVDFPELPIQKKIASILSAYDDLIENNNQRIKLLEEMAEEIYKEWFVRLRFPGFETTKFFDKAGNEVPHGTTVALPEGWELKNADKFESFSISKSKLSKFQGEKTYFATADISGIKIDSEGEVINWDNKPSRAQLKPELYSVFFARMSQTYKVLGFSEANSDLIDTIALSSGFMGLKALNQLCFAFLFSTIKGDYFHKSKDVFASGSTQVSLTNEGYHMIKLIEPKLKLIEDYGKIVYPFFDEINILVSKNKVIQETRDLLLPRLISGKLSVKNIEIEQNLMNV